MIEWIDVIGAIMIVGALYVGPQMYLAYQQSKRERVYDR